jgi:dihydroorotate dehydrogenase
MPDNFVGGAWVMNRNEAAPETDSAAEARWKRLVSPATVATAAAKIVPLACPVCGQEFRGFLSVQRLVLPPSLSPVVKKFMLNHEAEVYHLAGCGCLVSAVWAEGLAVEWRWRAGGAPPRSYGDGLSEDYRQRRLQELQHDLTVLNAAEADYDPDSGDYRRIGEAKEFIAGEMIRLYHGKQSQPATKVQGKSQMASNNKAHGFVDPLDWADLVGHPLNKGLVATWTAEQVDGGNKFAGTSYCGTPKQEDNSFAGLWAKATEQIMGGTGLPKSVYEGLYQQATPFAAQAKPVTSMATVPSGQPEPAKLNVIGGTPEEVRAYEEGNRLAIANRWPKAWVSQVLYLLESRKERAGPVRGPDPRPEGQLRRPAGLPRGLRQRRGVPGDGQGPVRGRLPVPCGPRQREQLRDPLPAGAAGGGPGPGTAGGFRGAAGPPHQKEAADDPPRGRTFMTQLKIERLVLSAPFGNWLNIEHATPTLGTYTWSYRGGRAWQLWRVLRTVRYYRRLGGWVNRLGLPNPGIESLVRHCLGGGHYCRSKIISVSARSTDEWLKVMLNALQLLPLGLELNPSCPNCDEPDASDYRHVFAAAVRYAAAYGNLTRLIVKLPPVRYRTRLQEAAEAGIAGYHCCNSLPTPGGGMSGAPLKGIALEVTEHVRRFVEYAGLADPLLIGGGGVKGRRDAQDFLDAGATHVAIGSDLFFLWRRRIHRDLARWLAGHADPAPPRPGDLSVRKVEQLP